MTGGQDPDPALAEWADSRPESAGAKLRRWRPRWRSGVMKGAERVLGSRTSWEWLVSDFVAISHLPSVRHSIRSVTMIEEGAVLDPRPMPPDTGLPDPTRVRPPVFLTELTDVSCHIPSGLVQLPSGHLFLGSDGPLRLGLLAGGAAQEMSDLSRAHRRLTGTWGVAQATAYYYHHIVDNCLPLLKAERAHPGLRVAVPAGQPTWYYDALTTLGLDWTIVPERAVRIEHLVLVDRAELVPGDVQLMRDRVFAPGTDRASTDVLFISRRGLPRFDEAAEHRMLDILAPLTVTTFDPSAASVAEQIAAFDSARMVVAAHGGALTNLVWSRRAELVIEVFARGYRGLEFSRIAQAAGIPYAPCAPDDYSAMTRSVAEFVLRDGGP